MSLERSNKLQPLLEKADAERSVFAVQYMGNREIPLYKFVLGSDWDFYHNDIVGNGVNTVCEVIRENRPCHLYLDMDAHGKTRDDVFHYWECLRPLFVNALRQKVKDDKIDIITLDSSNDDKGSLHIILKCSSHIFTNNIHCGAFVSLVGAVANESVETESAFKYVDLAVYSKNRMMRMWGSTKVGQDRFLKWDGVELNFQSWKASRICPTHSTLTKIELQDKYLQSKQTVSIATGWVPPFMNVIVDYLTSVLKDRFGTGAIHEIICVFPESLTYTVNTDIRTCLIANKTHKTNHMYFVVHVMSGTYRYSCRSSGCQWKTRQKRLQDIPNKTKRREENVRMDLVTRVERFPKNIQNIIDEWLSLPVTAKTV